MDNKLIAEIKRRGIPPLYAQDNSQDPTVYLEIYRFDFSWRWFVSECAVREDGGGLFFGFIVGGFKEWGYFPIPEPDTARCPLLVNYGFEPVPFSELKKEYRL